MPSGTPRPTSLILPATLALGLLVLAPGRAQAYLDPGTGSFILQAAVAAILAGAVTLKHSWHRVRNLFSRSSRDSSDLDLDD